MAMLFEDNFSGSGLLESHTSDSGHHWVYLGGGVGTQATLGVDGVVVVLPPSNRARYTVLEAGIGQPLYGLVPPYTIQTVVEIIDPGAGVSNGFSAGMGVYAPLVAALDSLRVQSRCELVASVNGAARGVRAAAGPGDIGEYGPFTGGFSRATFGVNTLTTVVSETNYQYVFNDVLFMTEAHSGTVPLAAIGFILEGPHKLKSFKVWEGTSLYPPGPPEPEPDPYDAGWWRRLSNATQTL